MKQESVNVDGAALKKEVRILTNLNLEPWIRDALRCPVTGAELVDGVGPNGEPELHSTHAEKPLAYPIRDGIPVLLEGEARLI